MKDNLIFLGNLLSLSGLLVFFIIFLHTYIRNDGVFGMKINMFGEANYELVLILGLLLLGLYSNFHLAKLWYNNK